MSRNPSCRCQCDTEPPFPDCFGCPVFELPTLPAEVTVEFSGVDWTMTPVPADVTTQHNLVAPPPPAPCLKGTTYHHFRALDLEQINTALTLKVNPGYGRACTSFVLPECSWLWNDVVAANSIWIDGLNNPPTGIPVLEMTFYEPLNPFDASSPWGRQYTPIVDSRCSMYSAGWRCDQTLDQYIEVIAYPQQIVFTDVPNGYFMAVTSGGTYHWIVDVFFKIGRSAINYVGGTASCPGPFGPWNTVNIRPTSPNQAMRSSFDAGQFGTHGPTSNPPFWNGSPLGGILPLGGLLGSYVKEIDCENDFSGDPLTLDYKNRSASAPARHTIFEITMPSTATLTYPI